MTASIEEFHERDIVYYKNLPTWPEFNIYDKNVDGLIPLARLKSWEQFHDVVKNYRVDEDGANTFFVASKIINGHYSQH